MSLIRINSVSKTPVIAIELSGLFTLYGVIIWIIIPKVLTSTITLYAYYILMSSAIVYYLFISPFRVHEDTLEERGLGPGKRFFLRTDNFATAWQHIRIPLVVTSSAIILVAWLRGSTFFITPDWYALSLKFSFYLFSAFAQDILFFSFVLLRLKEIIYIRSDTLKNIVVITLFATLFTLYHLPNIPLMVLSFFFALAFGQLFYKIPNLYVVVIAHAFLGTLLHQVYELHMRMGSFYGADTPQSLLMRNLLPFVDEIIGNRW